MCHLLSLLSLFANNFILMQINGSSESVANPTDVLSKNGMETANKEGKH
jgi:hypothetical protein